MKQWPTRFDVYSAERQLAHTKREASERIARVRSSIRSQLTKPPMLFVAISLGALLGAWFARRNGPRSGQDVASARRPVVGLVYTLLIRFGLQRLAEVWTRHRHPDAATATLPAKS